ncbi:uncharacterized protein LOC124927223 [Impatiens glandulifera]|uniref:uncharacterized protein LOC124927223 n=1 Tax=Impatiens glandulifera TaxID=253017 RepID=UPI001FB098EF|nr:uncharacterized protein LOC124927223 [Impatiens glandulifera]
MVNGQKLIFGMKEYALVTGLCFGIYPELDQEKLRCCPPLSVKYFKGSMSVKINKDDFDEDEESEHEEVTPNPPKPATKKRKVDATLKEAVNLKKKLAYESILARILTPPSATSSPRAETPPPRAQTPSPRAPTPSVGCEFNEMKEELKIEMKEELKKLKTELIKELKITIQETQETHLESFKKMEMIAMQETVGDDEKVNDGNNGKKDDVKEDDEKVEDGEKMDDEAKVEDGEKLDGVAKVDDVEVDLKVKVKDLKVKVKDEKSVGVDVKAQTNEEIMGGDDNDDNDDFQLYNTPPKGNYGRRVRKPKKDDSYTNPSLSKMPKTKDPMKVNHLQKFEDELLDKEIDAFCHLLRKRISYYPKTYKNSHVAIGDCLLSDRIRREHRTFIKDPTNYPVAEFKDYYMAAPHRYMPEWSTIDDVYMPVNINQKHWILCVERLQKYCIDVYDCDAYLYKNLDPYLKSFCDMIPHIFSKTITPGERVRYPKFNFEGPIQPMTYKRLPHPKVKTAAAKVGEVPWATESGDCGVFTLMYMEHLTVNQAVHNVTLENMEFFRQKMAVRLFHQIIEP